MGISGRNMPSLDQALNFSKARVEKTPSDPYVVVSQGAVEVFKTETIEDSSDPVWKKVWKGQLDPSKPLTFTVFDEDTFTADDFIGKCNVPLRLTAEQEFLLEPSPPPAPTGKVSKSKKKKIGKNECALRLKIVM